MPGEHDVSVDNGQQYLERYGKRTKGAGWRSFDHKGVHFVGLVNVVDLKAGGLGTLGGDQLAWLEDDLKGARTARRSSSMLTYRSGLCIPNGAGARRTVRKHCRT